MSERELSRRNVLRTGAALGSLGLVGGLAGCQGGGLLGGGGGGGGGGNAGSRTDAVPSRANALMYANVQGFIDDDNIREVVNASLRTGNPNGPQTVEEALAEAEQTGGVGAQEFEDMMVFGEIPEGSAATMGDSYFGALVWTSLSTEELRSAMTEDSEVSYTEETYNGYTLLKAESTPMGDQQQQAVGLLDDGAGVAGSEQAVRDAIDVAAGSGSAISGGVSDELTSLRSAPIKFAAEIPSDDSGGADGSGGAGGGMGMGMMGNIEMVSAAILYSTGNKLGIELNVVNSDSDSAKQLKQTLDLFMTSMQQEASQNQDQEGSQQLQDLLEKISTSRNGDTMTVTYEDSVDNIVSAIEEGGGGGVPMGPTA